MMPTKEGKCPWCERHNQTLYLSVGVQNGVLWTQWICDSCRKSVDPLADVLKQKG